MHGHPVIKRAVLLGILPFVRDTQRGKQTVTRERFRRVQVE
jgi:hypothetical protein